VKFSVVAALAVFSGSALAADISCAEEPGTRKYMCVNLKKVSANGDVRASTLYTGGPKGVEATPYTVVVNCSRGVMTLQDKLGVNFGGNVSGATELSRGLTGIMCAVPKPKKDPKLQQF
jgi:hypothetical protein